MATSHSVASVLLVLLFAGGVGASLEVETCITSADGRQVSDRALLQVQRGSMKQTTVDEKSAEGASAAADSKDADLLGSKNGLRHEGENDDNGEDEKDPNQKSEENEDDNDDSGEDEKNDHNQEDEENENDSDDNGEDEKNDDNQEDEDNDGETDDTGEDERNDDNQEDEENENVDEEDDNEDASEATNEENEGENGRTPSPARGRSKGEGGRRTAGEADKNDDNQEDGENEVEKDNNEYVSDEDEDVEDDEHNEYEYVSDKDEVDDNFYVNEENNEYHNEEETTMSTTPVVEEAASFAQDGKNKVTAHEAAAAIAGEHVAYRRRYSSRYTRRRAPAAPAKVEANGCPTGFKLDFSPRLPKCPGSGLCCAARWSAGCAKGCAQQKCTSTGGSWIPLSYATNPYTCEMPKPTTSTAASTSSPTAAATSSPTSTSNAASTPEGTSQKSEAQRATCIGMLDEIHCNQCCGSDAGCIYKCGEIFGFDKFHSARAVGVSNHKHRSHP